MVSDTLSHDTTGSILHVSAAPSSADVFSQKITELTRFDVVESTTVNDALAILKTRDNIRCIVSDYDIPDIDGLSFLQSVRAQYPTLPFILFTSEGNESVAAKAITARVTEYVIKERFQDQWEELATFIEESISYEQYQQPLADPELRARVILEATPDPIVIVQDESVCYSNSPALDLFEAESLEALAETTITKRFSANFQDETATTLGTVQDGDALVDRLNVTVVGHQGTSTPVELTAVSITWTGAEAVLLILRSRAVEKKTQQALQEQKGHFEALFNSIRDAILVADTDRRVTNLNPAFTQLFGYGLEDLEGKRTKYLYETEEEYEKMGDMIEGRASNPQLTTIINFGKKSGQVFPGETNVSYLRDHEGNVIGAIGIIRDVSRREERLRQLKIIDTVLRHNLSNDLTVIRGNAESIRDTVTGKVETWAQTIIDESEHLLETADKERQVTELLAEPQSSEMIDLSERLTTIVEDLTAKYPTADIILNVPETCEVTVVPEIGLAIRELIENAIDHSDQEHPEVKVSIERQDTIISITVADNGPGIPEMELKVLKGEKDIEPLYHGSGIGLWFVNLIVLRSDGVLEFDDNEPRGSVVKINLPDD